MEVHIMTIKECQIEIEKMLVYLQNFFCLDHIDFVWGLNAFLNPIKGAESLVEDTFERLYYEYFIATHIENETDLIHALKYIYNELKPHYCKCLECEKDASKLEKKICETALADTYGNCTPTNCHVFIID